MRVLLHTGGEYDPEGGIGQFLINLYKAIKEKGINVDCLYGKCSIPENGDEYLGNINKKFASTLSFVEGPLKFNKYIKNRNYDVVHSNAYYAYDVVWQNILKKNLKLITTLHGLDFGLNEELVNEIKLGNVFNYRKELILSKYCMLKSRFAHSKADILVSVSAGVAKEVKKYLHLNSIVIPNGFPSHDGVMNMQEKDNFALFVGTGAWRKGVRYLIDAFRAISLCNYEVRIVGISENEIINQLNIGKLPSNIQLLGKLKHEDVIEQMKKARMFLLPSLYEGMPLVVLEAMSYGAIPVVFDFNGSEEMIKNGVNGYIVSKRDVDSFVGRVNDILLNKQLEDRMRLYCGRNSFLQEWSNIANQYINLYEKLVIQDSR